MSSGSWWPMRYPQAAEPRHLSPSCRHPPWLPPGLSELCPFPSDFPVPPSAFSLQPSALFFAPLPRKPAIPTIFRLPWPKCPAGGLQAWWSGAARHPLRYLSLDNSHSDGNANSACASDYSLSKWRKANSSGEGRTTGSLQAKKQRRAGVCRASRLRLSTGSGWRLSARFN